DLNTIDQVNKLVDIGVDSLKIEGRMKTPEYAYTIVKNYRDKITKDTYSQKDLLDITNRAYTRGFIFGQKTDYINLEDSKKRRSLGKVKNEKGNKFFITNSDLLKKSILQVTTDLDKKLPFTLTKDYKKNDKIYLQNYPDAKVGKDIVM